MILSAYASPMPGNVSSCSLVAEFRSINSAGAFFSDGAGGFFSAAGAAFVSGFFAGAGACANPNVAKSNVVRTATISPDRYDFLDIANLLQNSIVFLTIRSQGLSNNLYCPPPEPLRHWCDRGFMLLF